MTLYQCIQGFMKNLSVDVKELREHKEMLIRIANTPDAEPYDIPTYDHVMGMIEGNIITKESVIRDLQSIIEEFEEDSE